MGWGKCDTKLNCDEGYWGWRGAQINPLGHATNKTEYSFVGCVHKEAFQQKKANNVTKLRTDVL